MVELANADVRIAEIEFLYRVSGQTGIPANHNTARYRTFNLDALVLEVFKEAHLPELFILLLVAPREGS